MLALVGASFYLFAAPSDAYQKDSQSQMSEDAAEASTAQSVVSSESGGDVEKGDAMIEKDQGAVEKDSGYSGEIISGSATPYLRYNKADFDKARSEGRGIYIYFYATWCPLCQAERPNIISTFNSIDVKDAVGFEAHWGDGQNTKEDDNAARDYGVSSQHTHIFVGGDGKVIDKKIGKLADGELGSKLAQAAQA